MNADWPEAGTVMAVLIDRSKLQIIRSARGSGPFWPGDMLMGLWSYPDEQLQHRGVGCPNRPNYYVGEILTQPLAEVDHDLVCPSCELEVRLLLEAGVAQVSRTPGPATHLVWLEGDADAALQDRGQLGAPQSTTGTAHCVLEATLHSWPYLGYFVRTRDAEAPWGLDRPLRCHGRTLLVAHVDEERAQLATELNRLSRLAAGEDHRSWQAGAAYCGTSSEALEIFGSLWTVGLDDSALTQLAHAACCIAA